MRIEDRYRRQGFNDAEVEVQPAIAADDTVALTFDVTEGPQQVLQDVELTGIEVTQRQGPDPGAAVRARQAGRSR